VTAVLQSVFCEGNGGGGGGTDGSDGVALDTALSLDEQTACGCASDNILLVSLSSMLCTFSPRPSTNFASCDKQQIHTVMVVHALM